MEAKVSEILENVLSLLSLEGSFEVEEKDDAVYVKIDTADAGKLIGRGGETLSALQLMVNLIVSKGEAEAKRVYIDVAEWKSAKEEELRERAKGWVDELKEKGGEIELEPMPSWQRRIVHVVVSELEGIESESVGEGVDRHLVLKLSK